MRNWKLPPTQRAPWEPTTQRDALVMRPSVAPARHLLEPHGQAHPRHRFLNWRFDLPGSSGIRLAIDPLEGVARRTVESSRKTHVQAESQVDRERRMAAPREFRGGEVVRPEQHGRPRADLVERTRSYAH